jgi:NADP-dependent 3-hydroxy acid dehydrogenase YdfG
VSVPTGQGGDGTGDSGAGEMARRAEPRVLVVTGGASGIGLATGELCARAGWPVVLLDLPEALERSRSAGTQECFAGTAAADVRDFAALEAALAGVTQQIGPLAGVVASAGIADQSSVLSGDPARWRTVIETNLIGTANTIRAAAPLLVEAGGGDLVVIASLSGRETYVGEPAYIASKWGTVGLGHAARRELAGMGVRVSLIEPGIVDTPLTRSSAPVRRLLESGPSLRPEDVAEAVLWVLSRPSHVAVDELALRPLGSGDIAFTGTASTGTASSGTAQ